MPPTITSVSNPRVKAAVRLRDRRQRDRSGTFLIEGFRELRRALQRPVVLRELYYCPELFLGHNEDALVEQARAAGTAAIPTSPAAFKKMSYRDRPEGLLGLAEQFAVGLETLPVTASLLLVVEAIEKPGNLGTMLRAAAAAGADGVLVCDPATDPFNPNVVRASLGTVFSIPLAVTDAWEAAGWLGRHGICSVAAAPDAEAAYWDADLAGPCAIVIGSEQYGLSARWREIADQTVRIPMPGPVDSLNAAAAAAVLLFEAVRQRARAAPS